MIRAVLTIARRDITATIFSRGFLIWLAMPVVGLVFGILGTLIAGRGPEALPATAVAVVDPGGAFAPWLQRTAERERTRNAYERVRSRWGAVRRDAPLPSDLARPSSLLSDSEIDRLGGQLGEIAARHDLGLGELEGTLAAPSGPIMTLVTAEGDAHVQGERLLKTGADRGGRFGAVLLVEGGDLKLMTRGNGADSDRIRYLAGLAWTKRALAERGLDTVLDHIRSAQPDITVEQIAAPEDNVTARHGSPLATGATTILFALISLLAGALLSNMVEEKANKIIEVLVASVPIPAIYAGKLIAMLAVSLIGVTVWGLMFGGGAVFALSQLPAGFLPAPDRGWPELFALGLAYFVCAYLIYGAVYLGIGSLCSSIREVQTLSMPVTILQMIILIASLGALDRQGTLWAEAVSWFPLSAPYMMAGRAATGTGIGIHLLAIAWQLVFAAFVIAASSRLFRYGVLRSGPSPSLWQLLRRRSSAAKSAD